MTVISVLCSGDFFISPSRHYIIQVLNLYIRVSTLHILVSCDTLDTCMLCWDLNKSIWLCSERMYVIYMCRGISKCKQKRRHFEYYTNGTPN